MHPVIELILNRTKNGSKPLERDDNYKLGLVIEGGGMRGVVSAGMVSALESLNLLNAFDSVYGTSAGAVNGAYFIAKQAAYGTTIYYENINNNKFINIKRIFSKKPIMSLEFLVYHVMKNEKILDWKSVIGSSIPLNIIVTSISKLKPIVLNDFKTLDFLLEALRASARMPLLAGPPVELNGDKFLDGGLYESIPYKTAIKDGCSHILILLTRPLMQLRGQPSFMEKNLAAKYLNRIHPALAKELLKRPENYGNDIAMLVEKKKKFSNPPFLYAIQPKEGSIPINRTEKRRRFLVNGAIEGFKSVYTEIIDKIPIMIEILSPFNESGHRF